jgi:hypothetical protein
MKKAEMNAKIFNESFSKTFSKGVITGMHLKWQSYLLLFENMIDFSLKTGHESPDSDPRLHSLMRVHQVFRSAGCPHGHQNGHQFPYSVTIRDNAGTICPPLVFAPESVF